MASVRKKDGVTEDNQVIYHWSSSWMCEEVHVSLVWNGFVKVSLLFPQSILELDLFCATFQMHLNLLCWHLISIRKAHLYEPSIDIHTNTSSLCPCICGCVGYHSGEHVIVSELPLILEFLECKWSWLLNSRQRRSDYWVDSLWKWEKAEFIKLEK